MPNNQFHKKVGLIASLLIGLLFIIVATNINLKAWHWFALYLIVLLYSNLPDLDHHISKIRKIILIFIFSVMALSLVIFAFVNIYIFLALLTLTGFLGIGLLKVKHRGPLHMYWFGALVSMPLLAIHWFLFVIGLTCYSSHIFVDRLFSGLKRKLRKIGVVS